MPEVTVDDLEQWYYYAHRIRRDNSDYKFAGDIYQGIEKYLPKESKAKIDKELDEEL